MTGDNPAHDLTEEALGALRGSIAKWEAIVAGNGHDSGSDNCPLCEVFRERYDEYDERECYGCPVAKAVHDEGCNKTPYEAWSSHQWDKKGHMPFMATTEEEKRLAQAELDFLISLLPRSAT